MLLLFGFQPHQLEVEVARVWSPLPVFIIIIITFIISIFIIIIIIIIIITFIISIFIIVIVVLGILPIEHLHLFCSQAQRAVSLLEKSTYL